MPANSFPIEKVGGFYIDETAIKSFIEIATKFTKAPYSVSIVFNDEFSHDSKDISSVLNHPEFRSNKCKSFTLRSSSPYMEDQRSEIVISCRNFLGIGKIKADISSDTDDLHIVRAELEREIKILRTRYDFLYQVPGNLWFLIFAVVGLFAGIKAGGWLSSVSKDQSKDAVTAIVGTCTFLGVFLSLGALYLMNKIKMFIFPAFTIAIGRSKDDFARKADTRKWAYRVVAAALATYLVKTFIFTS
jgi:hypothetical protein